MTQEDLRLLQGTLDTLILRALRDGTRHGYGIVSWVRNVTDEALQIEEGALYTALHRMQKRGWLEADWGVSDNNRRAKFYRLTDQGRRELERATSRWESYSSAVAKVLDAPREA